ncbi:Hypothetical predicted protein [Pelobates cultripes]|uniref:Uncharacterized protein n=1 Tax=Pelobates cultripes TaxID=61616 RepID=A0AAD1VPB9_PELCU|nr:Hypothetical predicted protein [Pelobates cultripes]
MSINISSLFGDFKNKIEIAAAVKYMQLSWNSVTRRCEVIVENVEEQLKKDIDSYTGRTPCKDSAQLDSARYEEQVQSFLSEFEKRFTDFTSIEPVASYLRFPFGEGIDVDYMASKVAALFELDSSAVES